MFEAILQSMDVASYEPLLATALAEYARRYAAELLMTAKDCCLHAGRSRIAEEDIELATELHDGRLNWRDVRERVLSEAKEALNGRAIPPVSDHTFLHRSLLRHEFLSRNYTYVPGIEAYPEVWSFLLFYSYPNELDGLF